MNSNLSLVVDILIYFLTCSFCAYAVVYALPLGLSLFSGGMLLMTFIGAVCSIFRVLTR